MRGSDPTCPVSGLLPLTPWEGPREEAAHWRFCFPWSSPQSATMTKASGWVRNSSWAWTFPTFVQEMEWLRMDVQGFSASISFLWIRDLIWVHPSQIVVFLVVCVDFRWCCILWPFILCFSFSFFFLIELATQFRLELIKAKALSVLENLITKVIDIYKLMEKWLGERYLNEMSRYSSAWLFCKHTLWNPVSCSQIPFTNTSVDPLGRLVCKPMKGAFT